MNTDCTSQPAKSHRWIRRYRGLKNTEITKETPSRDGRHGCSRLFRREHGSGYYFGDDAGSGGDSDDGAYFTDGSYFDNRPYFDNKPYFDDGPYFDNDPYTVNGPCFRKLFDDSDGGYFSNFSYYLNDGNECFDNCGGYSGDC